MSADCSILTQQWSACERPDNGSRPGIRPADHCFGDPVGERFGRKPQHQGIRDGRSTAQAWWTWAVTKTRRWSSTSPGW